MTTEASEKDGRRGPDYERYFELPKTGMDEGYILEQTRLAAEDSMARYDKKQPSAKPGTLPSTIALKARDLGEIISNPNLIDGEMFPGSYKREKEVVAMTARLFGKDRNDPTLDAGFLLSGGTESLNQALWMYRNRFFIERLGVDVRNQGIEKAFAEVASRTGKIPNPRILCPVNYHFSNAKAADLLGFGADSLAHYGLDVDFDVDFDSLEETIRDIYESGDEIILNMAAAGDTTKGKVHDIARICEIVKKLSEEYGKEAPETLIDAAGVYLFIAVMQDNPNYDGNLPEVSFKTEGVSAIIGDPHKQEMPYSCGMLVLRDWDMLNYTDVSKFSNYIDAQNGDKEGLFDSEITEGDKQRFQALATIPTSRSGSNSFAVWAYYMSEGLEGLRKKKEQIWSLVRDFQEYVINSEYYELVCEPQTQVLPFRFKGTGAENMEIYKAIKHHESDRHYISYDGGMFVRTEAQLKETQSEDYDNRYCGLYANFMEHNDQQAVDSLKRRLDEEAERIIRERTESH